jgi:hypothetical protein
MRKCPACGYLLFGDAETCKHCGTALGALVSSGLASAGTASLASAGTGGTAPPTSPFAAPPAAPPAPQPFPPIPPVLPPAPRAASPVAQDPYPGSAPEAPLGREYWTPPAAPGPRLARKESTGGRRVLLALICVASMAFGWVGYNRVFVSDPLPSGTSAFAQGHGVAYSSPDHTFDAQFPSAPTVYHRVIPVAASQATINLAQVQTDDYEIVAGSLVLPIPVPADRIGAELHSIMNEAVVAQDAKVVKEQLITRFGVPGIEISASFKDTYPARFMMLVSNTHVYFLGVHSKHATQRLYNALVSSLIMY